MLISSVPSPRAAAVTLSGRFDAHEVPAARPQLHHIVHTTPRGSVIHLDMSGIDFFDSRALIELVAAHTAARQVGVTMAMTAASDAVRTVLTLTGGLHDLVAA